MTEEAFAAGIDDIVIRYDGLDADRHVIEISDFADSMKGLGRIIGIAATFAATEKFTQHKDARPLKVVIGPPRDGCVIVEATLAWVDQHAMVSSTVSGLTVALVCYIFNRIAGKREEMKLLHASLETAIRQLGHRDQPTIDRLLNTVDKMAETLRPSVRQAVKPVGVTAGSMSIAGRKGGGEAITVDKQMRDAIDTDEPLEIGNEVDIIALFVEMNLDTRAARIATDPHGDDRYSAEITDPEIQVPNNAYALAFAAQEPLLVRAKPTLRDGKIERWYISGHI